MTEIDPSNIQAGDYVVAKFKDNVEGEFTISGIVRQVSERLYVASWAIYSPRADETTALVEILEHITKEPDIGYFGITDNGEFFARTRDSWMCIDPIEGYVADGYSWKQVVDILDGQGLMPVTA